MRLPLRAYLTPIFPHTGWVPPPPHSATSSSSSSASSPASSSSASPTTAYPVIGTPEERASLERLYWEIFGVGNSTTLTTTTTEAPSHGGGTHGYVLQCNSVHFCLVY
jgi:hypothetical protein